MFFFLFYIYEGKILYCIEYGLHEILFISRKKKLKLDITNQEKRLSQNFESVAARYFKQTNESN